LDLPVQPLVLGVELAKLIRSSRSLLPVKMAPASKHFDEIEMVIQARPEERRPEFNWIHRGRPTLV
jgi:hypothetical protein